MLHLKQILRKSYDQTLKTISTIKIDLKSLGVVPQNFQLAENAGRMLLCLILLMSITVLLIVTFTLSLLSLMKLMSKKLAELWRVIETPGYNVRYTVCHWVDAVKNTSSIFKKWLSSVWKKDGDSHQDSISTYSAMHGGLSPHEVNEFKNKQNKPVSDVNLEKRVREAGL